MTGRHKDPIRNIGPGRYIGTITKNDDPIGGEATYYFDGFKDDHRWMEDIANTVDPVPERFLGRSVRLKITEERKRNSYGVSQMVELIGD